jgi:hypothetical protein
MARLQPRVSHGGVVRVVAPGASWTGQAANLSAGGAFITGGPLLTPGRRITVAIDLNDGKPAVEAHARVAWGRAHAYDQQPAGVGVKFVRLEEQAARRIATVVDLHMLTPREVHHGDVRVQLPGLPARLKASAREILPSTLVVEAELSWLRIGGFVSAEVAPGDIRDGRLTWIGVEVGPSGVARLCLHVEVDEEFQVQRLDEEEEEVTGVRRMPH